MELFERLVLRERHPHHDIAEEGGYKEESPPPANKRWRSKPVPDGRPARGYVALKARWVAAVPYLAHYLKRAHEIEKWNEESTHGPSRRVLEFTAAEGRKILVHTMKPN